MPLPTCTTLPERPSNLETRISGNDHASTPNRHIMQQKSFTGASTTRNSQVSSELHQVRLSLELAQTTVIEITRNIINETAIGTKLEGIFLIGTDCVRIEAKPG